MPYFHAKRAGFVVVQNQALAVLVNKRLSGWRANNPWRTGQLVFEQHHRAEDDANCFEEVTNKYFHGVR